jgi:hypothetical protein
VRRARGAAALGECSVSAGTTWLQGCGVLLAHLFRSVGRVNGFLEYPVFGPRVTRDESSEAAGEELEVLVPGDAGASFVASDGQNTPT